MDGEDERAYHPSEPCYVEQVEQVVRRSPFEFGFFSLFLGMLTFARRCLQVPRRFESPQVAGNWARGLREMTSRDHLGSPLRKILLI